MLPENPDERRMFDAHAETFGGRLQAVAAALTIWSKIMPQEGSFAGQCAIMANEIGELIETVKIMKVAIEELPSNSITDAEIKRVATERLAIHTR